MGGCVQSKFVRVYSHFPAVGIHSTDYEALNLSESEIGTFYSIYLSMPPVENGHINFLQMCSYVHVENNDFMRKVFDIGVGDLVSFHTFVLGLWNFCTLDKHSYEYFVHDIYDVRQTGILKSETIHQIIEEVHGSDFQNNVQAKRSCEKLIELGVQEMDVHTFRQFSKAYNVMFYPIFSLQSRIRCFFMGDEFWSSKALNRIHMSKNEYVSLKSLLAQQLACLTCGGNTDNCSSLDGTSQISLYPQKSKPNVVHPSYSRDVIPSQSRDQINIGA